MEFCEALFYSNRRLHRDFHGLFEATIESFSGNLVDNDPKLNPKPETRPKKTSLLTL